MIRTSFAGDGFRSKEELFKWDQTATARRRQRRPHASSTVRPANSHRHQLTQTGGTAAPFCSRARAYRVRLPGQSCGHPLAPPSVR